MFGTGRNDKKQVILRKVLASRKITCHSHSHKGYTAAVSISLLGSEGIAGWTNG